MTTATFAPGRVADRVRARAQGYDPVRALVICLMAVPLALGWMAGKVCRLLWAVGALIVSAGVEGWSSGWATESRRR